MTFVLSQWLLFLSSVPDLREEKGNGGREEGKEGGREWERGRKVDTKPPTLYLQTQH